MGVNKKVSPSLGHRMVSRSVFPRQQDPPGWQEVPALPAVSIPLWPLSFPMPPWAFPGSAAWWWGGTVVQGALITHQTCWHVISDGQPPHLLFISHLPGCSVAWQSLSLSGPCAPLQRTQGEKTGGQVVQHHPRLWLQGRECWCPLGGAWMGCPSLIPRPGSNSALGPHAV